MNFFDKKIITRKNFPCNITLQGISACNANYSCVSSAIITESHCKYLDKVGQSFFESVIAVIRQRRQYRDLGCADITDPNLALLTARLFADKNISCD